MAYLITQYSEVREYFRNLFDKGNSCKEPKFSDFYEKELSVGMQRIVIDILKFDEWIHSKYGDCEDEGKSLSDVIFENYGDEAAALIDELI